MYKNVEIIAEVKIQSPFGFKSTASWEELFVLADSIGDIVSIHTDPRWGGSFEMLEKARSLTTKPILAKGIHAADDDIERAIGLGANWVLVVGRIPSIYVERCMIEPLSLEEISRVPEVARMVWNTRDLKNGGQKIETFENARSL